jgi:hypothetical protein
MLDIENVSSPKTIYIFRRDWPYLDVYRRIRVYGCVCILQYFSVAHAHKTSYPFIDKWSEMKLGLYIMHMVLPSMLHIVGIFILCVTTH